MKNPTKKEEKALHEAEVQYKQEVESEYREQQRREDKEAMDEYNSKPHY